MTSLSSARLVPKIAEFPPLVAFANELIKVSLVDCWYPEKASV